MLENATNPFAEEDDNSILWVAGRLFMFFLATWGAWLFQLSPIHDGEPFMAVYAAFPTIAATILWWAFPIKGKIAFTVKLLLIPTSIFAGFTFFTGIAVGFDRLYAAAIQQWLWTLLVLLLWAGTEIRLARIRRKERETQ